MTQGKRLQGQKGSAGGTELSPEARALLERRARVPAGVPSAPLTPRRPAERAPLSHAQQRIWLFECLEPGTAVYHLPKLLRLRGELDVPSLARALQAVVQRHEVLRTRYLGDTNGVWQEVLPAGQARVSLLRLAAPADTAPAAAESAVLGQLSALARCPFDLAGAPLPRATLARLAPDEHLLHVVFHHIAFDGWSTSVFVRDLSALYNAFRRHAPAALAGLPPLPIQYADLAVREQEGSRTPRAARDLEYWRDRLAAAPVELRLPTDYALPQPRTYSGSMERLELSAALVNRLRALARSERATLFAAILAGFQALLAGLAGTDDVVVGTPIARRDSREVEGLIGQLINTLAIRTDLSGDPSFRELLGRARDATRGAIARAAVPFDAVVQQLRPPRRPGRSPIFQVLLNFRELPLPQPSFHGLEVTVERLFGGTSLFDVDLEVTEAGQGLHCELIYAKELFAAATARRMAQQLATLLAAAAAEPELPISRLAPS